MSRSPQRAAERHSRRARASRGALVSKLLRWNALRGDALGGGALAAAVLLTPQVASAAAPTAVTIRVTSEGDASLVERIRGQLSDLDVTLQITRSTSLESSPAERARAASEVGRSTSSDIVVWFERVDASLQVHVLSVDSGNVLVRSVNTGASASVSTGDLRTSTLETVALVVRDAVAAWRKALTVELPAKAVDPPKASEVSTAPRAKPAHERLVFSPPPPLPWRIRSSLGWLAIASGSHATFQGLFIREELRRGRFGAGVTASTSLPTDVDDGPIRLRLRRMAGALHAAYRLPINEHFWLDGFAGGGVAVFSRSTEVLQGGASAAPSNDAVSPLLAAELMLTAQPWIAGPVRGVGFFVSVGLDYAFRPPSYDYATEKGVQSGPSIAALQPRLLVGVAWEIPLRSGSARR